GDQATYSSDGQHLAVACDNQTIGVFKATTGELLAIVPGGFPVAFSPDGWTLATGGQDRSVGLWDIRAKDANRPIRSFSEHSAYIADVAFTRDGDRLLAACWDGTVKTWDVSTGKETASFRGQVQFGNRCRFSPDARRLAWTSMDGIVKVWDIAT